MESIRQYAKGNAVRDREESVHSEEKKGKM